MFSAKASDVNVVYVLLCNCCWPQVLSEEIRTTGHFEILGSTFDTFSLANYNYSFPNLL